MTNINSIRLLKTVPYENIALLLCCLQPEMKFHTLGTKFTPTYTQEEGIQEPSSHTSPKKEYLTKL